MDKIGNCEKVEKEDKTNKWFFEKIKRLADVANNLPTKWTDGINAKK